MDSPSEGQPGATSRPSSRDLRRNVVRGGVAKVAARATSFALRIGSMMVMARLLDPKDFGLVAMVSAVTSVFSVLRDAGLSRASVQRDTITEEQLSALFWINTLLGVALALVFLGLAPVLVAFYREPRLFWVTNALGLGFILNGVGVQHSALIQRQMRFTAEAVIEIASLLVSSLTGIVLALLGFGYWSLVCATLVAPAVGSVGAILVARWRPGRPRRGAGVLSMIRFGGAVTVNSLLVYVAYNLDKVLVGRFAGAEALGFYGRAYQLVNIPTDNLNSAVGGVAFSALSRLQGEPERFRNFFLKGYALTLSLTVPITAACVVLTDDIVRVALGPKWLQVVPLLRLLAPTILVFAVINPMSWIMLAGGHAGRSLNVALVLAPLVIASYFIGLPFGAAGVATAFSVTMGLLTVPVLLYAVHDTPITPRDLAGVLTRPFLAGTVAAVAALVVNQALTGFGTPLVRLILASSILFGVYGLVLLAVLDREGYYLGLIRTVAGRGSDAHT